MALIAVLAPQIVGTGPVMPWKEKPRVSSGSKISQGVEKERKGPHSGEKGGDR